MRIVILVNRFPPKWLAGTEIATYNLAKEMIKRHEVTIITTHDEGFPLFEKTEGLNIHRVPRSKIRVFGFLMYWFKMFLIIKNIKPDIVHVQGLYLSIPAILAKKILNISYVVSGQGSDIYKNWPYKKFIASTGMRNAKISLALTENMKKEMKTISKVPIEIIPNGINTRKFNLIKTESRELLDISYEKKIIIFIGRLETVKGLKYLIEAFNIIKNKDKNLQLIIIGKGSEEQNIKKMVEKFRLKTDVMFLGEILNQKIPIYLSASDIFVLPSISEGFPVVILEAMATGLPIIATNIKGMSEIIEDHTNGFLVNPENPEKIADKICSILNDKIMIEKMFIANKNKSQIYEWEYIVKRLENLYYS